MKLRFRQWVAKYFSINREFFLSGDVLLYFLFADDLRAAADFKLLSILE